MPKPSWVGFLSPDQAFRANAITFFTSHRCLMPLLHLDRRQNLFEGFQFVWHPPVQT
ncbi:hypothetical protein RRSWK_00974 [Rhodopirellula sp. SWK7]|nr:hypothetical protein RRSWK_00974 [Rhodopirellula sp. SWK7]